MAGKKLSKAESGAIISTLQKRFEKNMDRHKDIEWSKVQARLEQSDKLWSLVAMEATGGEPDVIGYDKKPGNLFFVIALRNHQQVEETDVTIPKLLHHVKSINRSTVL